MFFWDIVYNWISTRHSSIDCSVCLCVLQPEEKQIQEVSWCLLACIRGCLGLGRDD